MSPQRVLVVDDEPGMTELVELVLEHHGHRVTAAHDGGQALAEARNVRFDVIMLDIMMPRLDGIEVCRRLREDPRLRETRIILCSARDEASVDWQEAGANAFLQKPFSVSRIPELIAQLNGG